MSRGNRRLHEEKRGFYHAYKRVVGPSRGYDPIEDSRDRELFAAHLRHVAEFLLDGAEH